MPMVSVRLSKGELSAFYQWFQQTTDGLIQQVLFILKVCGIIFNTFKAVSFY